MTAGRSGADSDIDGSVSIEENRLMTAETACTLIPQQLTDSPADPTVSDLVARAKVGDRQAWDALIERYAPLIWSICRRHRLGRADADDVAQSVWLRLVDQLDRVRDPAALPGWLATTARRECLRVLCATQGPRATMYALDVESLPDERAGVADQGLLAAERHAALREAFDQLPPNGKQLMSLLIADQPLPGQDAAAPSGRRADQRIVPPPRGRGPGPCERRRP